MEDFIMAAITDERLDHWFNTNQNVLLSGKHGVGKTARIQSCFERHGLVQNDTYLYFSASTLDPWVDLIGVPKEQLDKNGDKYLGIIRPQNLYKGNVVAIFFDEYNRSPKKVRNAVMELIQKKSINGLVFPNLKCVWAAVNPTTEDDVYDVEKIDPAQEDRFQVQVSLPYACDSDFFIKRFGDAAASAAIEWWNELPEIEKNKVSPRRLQYALDDYMNGGDMEFVLPVSANITKFRQSLKNGSVEHQLRDFFSKKDPKATKAWFSSENNCNGALRYILNNKEYFNYFLPFINKEKLMALMSSNDKVLEFLVRNRESHDYQIILQNIMVGTNDDLKAKVRRLTNKIKSETPDLHHAPYQAVPGNEVPVFKPKHTKSNALIANQVAHMNSWATNTIEQKVDLYNRISDSISDDIDEKSAMDLLQLLQKIVSSSSVATLKSDDFASLASVVKFLVSRCVNSSTVKFSSSLADMAKLLKQYAIYDVNYNNQGGADVSLSAC
jgi:hypothetical protein